MRRRLTTTFAVGLLMVALIALAVAPAASAGTAAVTMHGTAVAPLDLGAETWGEDGTLYTAGWTMLGLWLTATGPESGRFPGWMVMYLDVEEPPKGDNLHTGYVVLTRNDPRGATGADWPGWELFSTNPDDAWLWQGTWNGVTHNKRNHDVHLVLYGCNENAGLTADVRMFFNVWTVVTGVAHITP